MSISQSWIDDLTLTYSVQNEKSCRNLITTLQQANIQHFKLEASFMQDYQLQEFIHQWGLQSKSKNQNQPFDSKKKKKMHIQRDIHYPKEFIMDLGTQSIKGSIFMDVYKEQLQRMRQEYEIKISTNGQKLYIFMKEGSDLNMICKNKLQDMSHSLHIFFGHQYNLVRMFEVSLLLRQKLFKQGVNVLFKRQYGNYFCVFYSTSLTVQKIIFAIQKITSFDISIFSLRHKSIPSAEAESVKSAIKQILKDFTKTLQEEYQIQIQFSEDNYFIVFHVQHAIFADEPISKFQQRLNSLVVLSVKSKKIRQFDNNLKKFVRKSGFVSSVTNKKRDQTYIAIDLFKIHIRKFSQINKQVQQFLQLFLILIEPNYQLKVYLNHLAKQFTQIKNYLLQLSQDNNLILQNDNFYNDTQRKAIFKLKDLSGNILFKRQKELLLFLQGLLKPIDNKSNQHMSFIDQSNLQVLSNKFNSQASIAKSSILQEKYSIPWLKLNFAPPKRNIFNEQKVDFRKDRRSRQLQNLFSSNSTSKFKIWSLQINKQVKLPQQIISNHPYILKLKSAENKLGDSFEVCTLQNFKVKEEGFIGFQSNQLSITYIPLYIFEKIQ